MQQPHASSLSMSQQVVFYYTFPVFARFFFIFLNTASKTHVIFIFVVYFDTKKPFHKNQKGGQNEKIRKGEKDEKCISIKNNNPQMQKV